MISLHDGARYASPMIPDIEIWRSAKPLIDRHGADTATVAAMRADELLERGDVEGQAVWKRIARAIEELLSTAPSGPLH
jgi:hypothetical protein